MEHTAAEWKKLLPESYFWIDFTSMPQPLAALPEEVQGAACHAGQVSDHREAQGVTEDVAVLVEQLKAAVDSIPSYIERCVEMIVLTPSVKHADRKGDCCDFNSWRQRGWCRLEFVPVRTQGLITITARRRHPGDGDQVARDHAAVFQLVRHYEALRGHRQLHHLRRQV
jgi:hypothetical protein